MLLAATTTTAAKPDSQQLSVGPLTGALAAVAGASGPLTRPAWAPGLNEVWIGSGANLLRIPSIGTAASTVTYASPSGTVFAIRSVAFSPDGVRIALILAQSDNNAQLFIGSVVRTDDGASIENLEQITPSALRLTDVAWNDANTLYAIGADTTRPGSFGIWSVEVDGSLLSPRTTANLPGAPDTITASQGCCRGCPPTRRSGCSAVLTEPGALPAGPARRSSGRCRPIPSSLSTTGRFIHRCVKAVSRMS